MAEEIGYVDSTLTVMAICGVVGTILLALILVMLYARR